MNQPVRLGEEAPGTVTIYCVQAYWKDRHKLAAGRLRQFRFEKDARRAGPRLRPREAGALVYSVSGCPFADIWGEPRLLAAYGEAPEGVG